MVGLREAGDGGPPLRISPALRVAAVLALLVTVAAGALSVDRAVGREPGRPDIVDAHELYLAGRFAREGRFASAYDPGMMAEAQRRLGGREILLPFTYPPPMGLVLAPFAALPLVPAFLLASAASLALYLVALRRLAGDWFWPALLAASPALLISLKIGQNGLFTAALAAFAAGAAKGARRGAAGLATGVLASLKPHLAVTLPLLHLVRGDGRALAVTLATGGLLWMLAIVVFGIGSVEAFVAALGFAGRMLNDGSVPLHRMASAYATLRSLGADPVAAMAAQAIVALAVVVVCLIVAWRRSVPSVTAGLMLLATLFISPYLYDYDLALAGPALALLLPALSRRLSSTGVVLLLVGFAAAESIGPIETVARGERDGGSIALIAPALGLCLVALLGALARPAKATSDAVVMA